MALYKPHLNIVNHYLGLEMNIVNYQIIDKSAFKVAGVRRITPYAGGTWGIVKSDGSMNKMFQIAGEQAEFLGLCFGFDEEGNNDYMVGFVYSGNDPENYDIFCYPHGKWLIVEATGTISNNSLGKTWEQVYHVFLPQSGYKQKDLPTFERYIIWDDAKNICKVEIGIPLE